MHFMRATNCGYFWHHFSSIREPNFSQKSLILLMFCFTGIDSLSHSSSALTQYESFFLEVDKLTSFSSSWYHSFFISLFSKNCYWLRSWSMMKSVEAFFTQNTLYKQSSLFSTGVILTARLEMALNDFEALHLRGWIYWACCIKDTS